MDYNEFKSKFYTGDNEDIQVMLMRGPTDTVELRVMFYQYSLDVIPERDFQNMSVADMDLVVRSNKLTLLKNIKTDIDRAIKTLEA